MTQFGYFAVSLVAGAAGEIDHDGHAQLCGQFHGALTGVGEALGDGRIRMQRIAVGAERADGEPVVVQLLLELFQFASRCRAWRACSAGRRGSFRFPAPLL